MKDLPAKGLLLAGLSLIEDKNGKILLTKRNPNLSYANSWVLPGGKLDAGEDLQQCSRREALEETNIDVSKYPA